MLARPFLTAALTLIGATPLLAQDMLVAKNPSCGCCGAWMARMQDAGFTPAADNMEMDALYQLKQAVGVPEQMVSCHTAMVADYVIEGHVPAADIRRLLADAPGSVVGLAVPGMPTGAPGMEYQNIQDAYDVYLIHADGTTSVYASYPEG